MFLHVCVILFTGGSASVHAGIHPPPRSRPPRSRHPPPREQAPPSRHPMGGGTPPPWDQAHPPPPEHSMLGDTVNVRAVRILLECNLFMKIILCFQMSLKKGVNFVFSFFINVLYSMCATILYGDVHFKLDKKTRVLLQEQVNRFF